jgi:hypothetical protein
VTRPTAGLGFDGTRRRGARMGRGEHRAALAGLIVVLAVVGWGLPISSSGPQSAQVRLSETGAGEGPREVDAGVRISPAGGAEDAHFFNVTAWQGGGSVISELERVGPGLYRSTDPIPVDDGWKALVRLHVGDSLLGVPVYLPEDRAIPAAAVPARPAFTREFVRDLQILQRERKEGVSGWLTGAAYLTVAVIAASLMALIAWALLRLEGLERRPSRWRRSPAAGREPVATS